MSDNWQKAQPSTTLGTPALDFYVINFSENIEEVDIGEGNMQSVWQESNSTYAKAIRGIQMIADLYMVGPPQNNSFTIVVASNSHPGSNPGSYRTENSYLSNAITEATGLPCDAYHAAFNGSSFYYND